MSDEQASPHEEHEPSPPADEPTASPEATDAVTDHAAAAEAHTDGAEPAPAAPESAPSPITALVAAGVGPQRYHFRFAMIYGTLAGVLLAALASFVILAVRPGAKAPAPWSSWAPPNGSTAAIATSIATHVGAQYHLNKTGAQLVAVIADPPVYDEGTSTKIAISEVAISKTPNSDTDLTIDPTSGTWTYEFCGLGSDCSIAAGAASITRGRLVRREALEVALYTFKYDPSITSIIAYMPPPPGQTPTEVLYFQKSNYAQQLREPLAKTLPLATPPLPTEADTVEAPTIDKLTLSDVFSFTVTGLDNGSAALLLAPVLS